MYIDSIIGEILDFINDLDIEDIIEEQKRLNELFKLYEDYRKDLEESIEDWEKNEISLRLKEVKSKINEIKNKLNQKYERIFNELMEHNEQARALFSLLTDMTYLDPFKPILEKYINREIKIPVTTTINVKFKPTSIEELARKIRSVLLGIIDPYNNCFGDLRNLKDYNRKFIELLVTLIEASKEAVKVIEAKWVKPLNDIKTFMVVVKGDYFDVLRQGYKLAEKIAKKHGCKELYSRSVAPIEDGDSYRMVYHFV